MPEKNLSKKSFFQKRIPTLIGLAVLIIALVAGTILFSQGTGVFAPRATPQTTPKKIRLTNITDSGFTVSFLTDEQTVGHIKYGTDPKKTNSQASDDRDQLSGAVGKYSAHHISVRGLEPNTTFYYILGTGSGSFDNNGESFSVKTTQRVGVPSAAKTIYGSVVSPEGSPAEGTIVYIKTQGAGEMSSLVKSSGSWAIPLSNARLEDGSAYAQIQDSDVLTIFVQGLSTALTSEISVAVTNAQPVANITLGQSKNLASSPPQATTPPKKISPQIPGQVPDIEDHSDKIAIMQPEDALPTKKIATLSGGLSDLVKNSDLATKSSSIKTPDASSAATVTTIDLTKSEADSSSPTVNSTQPKITGRAAPNVTISIQVHSDTNIDQYIVADSEGNFELDLTQLEQELEPGEHTVTYSYEDPLTGETVTKTQTFYVSDTGGQLAQADTGETAQEEVQDNEYPYGSSNPYPLDSEDETESAESTDSGEATDSGRVSVPSTTSAIPVSGSVGTTYSLIFGGLFFILAGAWSWWIANNLEEELVV